MPFPSCAVEAHFSGILTYRYATVTRYQAISTCSITGYASMRFSLLLLIANFVATLLSTCPYYISPLMLFMIFSLPFTFALVLTAKCLIISNLCFSFPHTIICFKFYFLYMIVWFQASFNSFHMLSSLLYLNCMMILFLISIIALMIYHELPW